MTSTAACLVPAWRVASLVPLLAVGPARQRSVSDSLFLADDLSAWQQKQAIRQCRIPETELGAGCQKSENRNPRAERSPKSEGRIRQHHRHSGTAESGSALTGQVRLLRLRSGSFGVRVSTFFRTSGFGFRIWHAPAALVPAQPTLAAIANRARPRLPGRPQRTYAGRASVLVSPLEPKTP